MGYADAGPFFAHKLCRQNVLLERNEFARSHSPGHQYPIQVFFHLRSWLRPLNLTKSGVTSGLLLNKPIKPTERLLLFNPYCTLIPASFVTATQYTHNGYDYLTSLDPISALRADEVFSSKDGSLTRNTNWQRRWVHLPMTVRCEAGITIGDEG